MSTGRKRLNDALKKGEFFNAFKNITYDYDSKYIHIIDKNKLNLLYEYVIINAEILNGKMDRTVMYGTGAISEENIIDKEINNLFIETVKKGKCLFFLMPNNEYIGLVPLEEKSELLQPSFTVEDFEKFQEINKDLSLLY